MPILVPSPNTSSQPRITYDYNFGYIYLVSAVVALGGLLFGFDLSIISGTVRFFSQHFQLDEYGTGWAVGCINIGSAVGALLAGKLSDSLGRKKLLLICALLFAVSGVGTGWASSFTWFVLFRMLSGVAVGTAALVCPMYIAEVAVPALRGRLVACYQLAITLGILLAYVSNYFLLDIGPDNWRWMFSSQAVPALLFFGGLFAVAESPRWLIRKGQRAAALAVLTRIGGPNYAQAEADSITQSFAHEVKEHVRDLFRKDMVPILLIGAAIAIFSQADGQNSLFSYAPEIFQQAGMPQDTAFLQSVILGLINFVFTFVAIGTVDRIGRRKLLLYGSALLCADAAALALAFYFRLPGGWVLSFVLGFIAIYAATLGPVTWVALSEIFPNRVRGNAMAAATLTLWLANFVATASFPVMQVRLGLPGTFAIHAAICLLYFLFVKAKVPETKGKSLEEIEALLTTAQVVPQARKSA
ncbi:sugar porter family MFS transporter [Hymenobacter terrenus]|uniref:sugar porter family MFS transporter n=1 Tax=Hymenobacter terrenus TaxID=1629124 RepID=UPI0006198122|nr:sugar porter family MFS transporter [Hymenobacter terrenus]